MNRKTSGLDSLWNKVVGVPVKLRHFKSSFFQRTPLVSASSYLIRTLKTSSLFRFSSNHQAQFLVPYTQWIRYTVMQHLTWKPIIAHDSVMINCFLLPRTYLFAYICLSWSFYPAHLPKSANCSLLKHFDSVMTNCLFFTEDISFHAREQSSHI